MSAMMITRVSAFVHTLLLLYSTPCSPHNIFYALSLYQPIEVKLYLYTTGRPVLSVQICHDHCGNKSNRNDDDQHPDKYFFSAFFQPLFHLSCHLPVLYTKYCICSTNIRQFPARKRGKTSYFRNFYVKYRKYEQTELILWKKVI